MRVDPNVSIRKIVMFGLCVKLTLSGRKDKQDCSRWCSSRVDPDRSGSSDVYVRGHISYREDNI